MNLIKAAGRLMGLATKTVEVKNLVVGDLPFNASRGDFFMCIQCKNNPDMVTSIAEDGNPKVVHFPEVLTLRMRHSPLESKVRIVVKELNLLGAQEICECYISAMSVCDWARDPAERIKRIVMKPLNLEIEADTPPWLLMEFSDAMDPRDLESIHGDASVVRTVDSSTGVTKERDFVHFKNRYSLVDVTGHAVAEPFESDLDTIARSRKVVSRCYCLCHSFVILLLIGYAIFRFYIYSCYRQFESLTIADLQGEPFPISDYHLNKIVQRCDHNFVGTGIEAGESACRPTVGRVLQTCHHVPLHQPRPTAFAHVVNEYFGTTIEGAQCFEDNCELRAKLVEVDYIIVLGGLLLVVSTYLLRLSLNTLIRSQKSNIQRERAKQLQKSRVGATGLPLIEDDSP